MIVRSHASLVTCVIALAALLCAAAAEAQFLDDAPRGGTRLASPRKVRLQVGMTITAPSKNMVGIKITMPVPTDWPEQKVKLVSEEISPEVKSVRYRVVGGTTKQILITIPRLRGGSTARVMQIYEVERFSILEPENSDAFVIPERLDRDTKAYLAASPFIETRNQKIRSLAKQLAQQSEGKSGWKKVETIYEWVRENVEYKDGKLKGAVAALKDGDGDCEELTSLFIALCRVNDIPARTVWIPGHCYPEFYLADKEGRGHWFPCQAAGSRAFGSMTEIRPILQKGDNFKVPESRERQRYVAEYMNIRNTNGTQPKFEFIRKVLPN